MNRDNYAFYFVLAMVWMAILALSAIINIVIVPIQPPLDSSTFVEMVFGGGKVLVSMILVLLWLLSWYKSLSIILHYELSKSSVSPTDSQKSV